MPTLTKITPCLWFDTEGEEAARFYTGIFEDSRILRVTHYGSAGPRPAGMVMMVTFEIAGQDVLRDPEPEKAQWAMKAVLGMGKIDMAAVQRAVDGVPA